MDSAIKDAFRKVRQDILSLQAQTKSIESSITDIKRILENPADDIENPTIQQITPTNPTDDLPLYALKTTKMGISIGNDGVPTDRQTNQQTDRHNYKFAHLEEMNVKNVKDDEISKIEELSTLLNSLDSIKKDIRQKFKHLTPQEMTVFSTIYQLEEEGLSVDYSLVSQKLSLSESSIRDYTQKLIQKGIPIQKLKQNNKKIFLSVNKELKKIASLQTILALREL